MCNDKIGKACPSIIKVTIFNLNKTVYSQFLKTYCGHIDEIRQIRLDNETTKLIEDTFILLIYIF